MGENVKQITIAGNVFSLIKADILDLKSQCDDALLEIRLEEVAEKVKTFGECKTLSEYLGLGGDEG